MLQVTYPDLHSRNLVQKQITNGSSRKQQLCSRNDAAAGSKVASSKFENFLYKSLESKDKDGYSFINVYSKKTRSTVVDLKEDSSQHQPQSQVRNSSSHRPRTLTSESKHATATLSYSDEIVTTQQKTIKSNLTSGNYFYFCFPFKTM